VVGEAVDGRSALRLARELAPQVVLLDIGLPDLSGFEVAERLGGAAARVVFVSSESGIFIPKEMVHYGFSKAAQLVIARVEAVEWEEAEDLGESGRGAGGFSRRA